MDSKKTPIPLILAMALLCVFLFADCYTQLMTYQGETLGAHPRRVARDCSDCEDVAPSAAWREVCVWERDIFGYPEMRCYNTNHHSAWVYFHNTPWWYRNHFSWHNSRGCPPYYFYDRITGICRYYTTYYPPPRPPNDSPGSGSDMVPEAPARRNSRGRVPTHPSEVDYDIHSASSSSMFSGGGSVRQLSPVSSPTPSTPSTPSDPSQGQTLSRPQEGGQSEQKTSQPSTPATRPQQPERQQRNDQEPPPRRNTRGR
ncbi:MAG: hypothetical protein LBU70_11080 [Chitinispirillales bacterium]|nr:hypothetical protein [Chitinispirillales bacterium]